MDRPGRLLASAKKYGVNEKQSEIERVQNGATEIGIGPMVGIPK